MIRPRAFLFSLEAAFSLTLFAVAAAHLLAFSPQEETAGEFLACADIAGALAESRAFSSQGALSARVAEAGALSGACVEAEAGGAGASSCGAGEDGNGEEYSFSFPIWKDGRLGEARAACHAAQAST
ncbi:MAG: hypothetical protein WC717_00270 [Candidatus Micrarchaeia archaeon]|jgi:hypothetical protein